MSNCHREIRQCKSRQLRSKANEATTKPSKRNVQNEHKNTPRRGLHAAGNHVVTIIGMLAAIAIPNFIKARSTSQMNACINNLRQIDEAIQQWALENKKDAAATVAYSDISAYLKNSVICPSGGTTFATSY